MALLTLKHAATSRGRVVAVRNRQRELRRVAVYLPSEIDVRLMGPICPKCGSNKVLTLQVHTWNAPSCLCTVCEHTLSRQSQRQVRDIISVLLVADDRFTLTK
jgi:hypothetical protein